MKLAAALAGLSSLTLSVGLSAAGERTWEESFRTGASVHYVATSFEPGGASHRLEVWRLKSRVRRDTDGVLTLLGEQSPDGTRFRVLDRARRLAISVRAEGLQRLGHFPAWAALRGGPERRGPRTTWVPLHASAHTPAGDCSLHRIDDREVCWSSRFGIVLRVRDAAGSVTFRVDAVDGAVDAKAFTVDTAGLADIDADRELTPDD